MKKLLFLIPLIYLSFFANAQPDTTMIEHWSQDEEVRSSAKLLEASLECAAISDILSWNPDEHRRLLLVATDAGRRVWGAYAGMLGAEIMSNFDDIEKVPVNPITGDLFDPETDTVANLFGFASQGEMAMFFTGSDYGEKRAEFFENIPYGGSDEMWRINIEAEFKKRNCSQVGLPG